MAGELRARNAALLVKIESSEGVDATPTAADAIMVENVVSGMGTGFIESTEITGSLDAGAPAVIGAPTSWTMRGRLRGVSGALAPGNLPPADALLQIAGFERIDQVAVNSDDLAAGSATSATLGTGFSNTAQVYRGVPLDVTVGANHFWPIITDYSPGRLAMLSETFPTPLTTSNKAAIPACALYRPISANVPTATVYHYLDGILRKLLGARATGTISMDAAGIPYLELTLTGTFGGESDAAIPSGVNPSGLAAPQFVQGALRSPAFTVDRKAIGVANYSLDLGNELISPADPNTENGFSNGVLIGRDTRLNINPQMTLVATQDVFAALRAGDQWPIVAKAGHVAGNRLAITVPAGQLIEAPDQDDQGIMRRQWTVKANGSNSAAFLCFY